jgi:hypothetical protein
MGPKRLYRTPKIVAKRLAIVSAASWATSE